MVKYGLYGLILCVVHPLMANMGPQGFGEYLNYYFIETGTYTGCSIEKALGVGFKEIRSIESNEGLYRWTTKKFASRNLPNVKIVKGDSAQDLWDLIKDIDQEATFWLDAHRYPPSNEGNNCPLIEELEQISWHPIKTHTILIDDMHCAGTDAFDYVTKEDLIAKIKKINPDYVITYVPGGDQGEYPQNVMVARVPR